MSVTHGPRSLRLSAVYLAPAEEGSGGAHSHESSSHRASRRASSLTERLRRQERALDLGLDKAPLDALARQLGGISVTELIQRGIFNALRLSRRVEGGEAVPGKPPFGGKYVKPRLMIPQDHRSKPLWERASNLELPLGRASALEVASARVLESPRRTVALFEQGLASAMEMEAKQKLESRPTNDPFKRDAACAIRDHILDGLSDFEVRPLALSVASAEGLRFFFNNIQHFRFPELWYALIASPDFKPWLEDLGRVMVMAPSLNQRNDLLRFCETIADIAKAMPLSEGLPFVGRALEKTQERMVSRMEQSPHAGLSTAEFQKLLRRGLRIASECIERDQIVKLEKKWAGTSLSPVLRSALRDTLLCCSHPRVHETLDRLFDQAWFRDLHEHDPNAAALIAASFGVLVQHAETSLNSGRALLLRNTVQIALEDGIPAEALIHSPSSSPMDSATDREGIIQKALQFDTTFRDPNSTLKEVALFALPRHVNFHISGQRIEKSIDYLEAEYRAWSVGSLARNLRWPSQEEAVRYFAGLLSSNAPSQKLIQEAIEGSPERFGAILKEIFGFGPPTSIRTAEELMVLAGLFVNGRPQSARTAEKGGWPGYHVNQRRPESS